MLAKPPRAPDSAFCKRMAKWFQIGVALGGGGARGLAHLGVLCVLERAKIPIDLLTGTSMGALVGAVYALTPRCDFVAEKFRRYLESKEFQKTNPDFLREKKLPVPAWLERTPDVPEVFEEVPA